MKEWNLDKLYLSFQDQQFNNDLNEITKLHHAMNTYRIKTDEPALVNYLNDALKLNQLVEKVACFISLTLAVDTTNSEALKYSDQLDELLASFVEEETLNNEWIATFNLDTLKAPIIKEHLYILKEIQAQQKYTLDKKSESIIAHMQNTGSNAFSKLKDQLIAAITVTIDDKQYPLTEVLNMAYSKDKETRKKSLHSRDCQLSR